LLIQAESVFLEALPLPVGSLVFFLSSGSYSYPCISPQREQQFDLYDQVEEELGGGPI
jgi:hypothetical protein